MLFHDDNIPISWQRQLFGVSDQNPLTEWLLQIHLYDVEPPRLECLERSCPHRQKSAAAEENIIKDKKHNAFSVNVPI